MKSVKFRRAISLLAMFIMLVPTLAFVGETVVAYAADGEIVLEVKSAEELVPDEWDFDSIKNEVVLWAPAEGFVCSVEVTQSGQISGTAQTTGVELQRDYLIMTLEGDEFFVYHIEFVKGDLTYGDLGKTTVRQGFKYKLKSDAPLRTIEEFPVSIRLTHPNSQNMDGDGKGWNDSNKSWLEPDVSGFLKWLGKLGNAMNGVTLGNYTKWRLNVKFAFDESDDRYVSYVQREHISEMVAMLVENGQALKTLDILLRFLNFKQYAEWFNIDDFQIEAGSECEFTAFTLHGVTDTWSYYMGTDVLEADGADTDRLIQYTCAANKFSTELEIDCNNLKELCKVSKEDMQGCAVVRDLVTLVCRLCGVESEESIKEKQETIATNALNEAQADFSGMSLFEKYSFITARYHTEGKSTYTSGGIKYSIDDIFEPSTAAKPNPLVVKEAAYGNQKDSVTPEELLRLRAHNYIASQMSGLKSGLTIPTGGYDPELKIRSYGYSFSKTVVEANNVATKYAYYNACPNTDIVGVVARMNDFVRLETALIYGAKLEDPTTLSDDVDVVDGILGNTALDVIKYQPSLMKSLPSMENGFSITPFYYRNLPAMTNIQHVAGDSESSLMAYYELMYLYCIMVRYAEDTTYSGLVQVQNEKGELIDKFELSEEFVNFLKTDPATVTDEDVAHYKSQIQCYLAIADALRYLGISQDKDTALGVILSAENEVRKFADITFSDIEYATSADDLMAPLFSAENKLMSEDYNLGVEISATYIPLETNVYDVASLKYMKDTQWVQRFHYGFGFYRKALYMDTNVDAAVEGYVTGGKSGNLRIVTLRDLLEPEKDIVLYVDDNFYNVKQIAEIQGKAYEKAFNNAESMEGQTEYAGVWDWIMTKYEDIIDLDIESIVKSGGKTVYSDSVKERIDKQTSDKDVYNDQDSTYVMGANLISRYLNVDSTKSADAKDEYTVMQPFAVTSAIYRQTKLFNIIQSQASNPSPVFVSSPNLAYVTNVPESEFMTIYNYTMLRNLSDVLGIDCDSMLDLDSPLFMDIYGNILTEGGLVVIPAASNATLYAKGYNIYTTGFLYLYQNGKYKIPKGNENMTEYMQKYFYLDGAEGVWKVKNNRIKIDGESVPVLFDNLQFNEENTQDIMMGATNQRLNAIKRNSSSTFKKLAYLVTEVLRGAPIEEIDKEVECIESLGDLSGAGIYIASKIDTLMSELLPTENGNSYITLPNIMYLDNVEYVLLYAFKIIFAGLFLMAMYRLYIDSIDRSLGFKTICSFAISVTFLLVGLFATPYFMDLSYYQVNKLMLQEDVEYIAMLNLEKESQGREIGLTSIDTPESETVLYIKLDDVKVPWYNLLNDILFTSSIDTLDEAYEQEFKDSPFYNLPNVERKGNNLYMDVSKIFESSIIEYDVVTNQLVNKVQETPYASFVIPYYAILDYLVDAVNDYNNAPANNFTNFTYEIQRKGIVRTYGLTSAYFTSPEFMGADKTMVLDLLGLRQIYDDWDSVTYTRNLEGFFTGNELYAMRGSAWYADQYPSKELSDKLDDLDREARLFIAHNREVLGKVSDETFLKVMALALAVRHNDIMNMSTGSSIEIFDVDARDIIRLSIADKQTVMKNSAESFARFAYTTGGTWGCILIAVLILVYFVGSIVKPLCLFVILAMMIVSLVIRRLVLRESNKAVEGFIITLAILCGVNSLYALVLKGSILLANLGISMSLSIILQIVLQVGYLFIVYKLTMLVVSDWKSYGANVYQMYSDSIIAKMVSAGHHATTRVQRTTNSVRDSIYKAQHRAHNRYPSDYRKKTGRDILVMMHSKDERRKERRARR